MERFKDKLGQPGPQRRTDPPLPVCAMDPPDPGWQVWLGWLMIAALAQTWNRQWLTFVGEDEVLRLAGGVESDSEHPLARAIVAAARLQPVPHAGERAGDLILVP